MSTTPPDAPRFPTDPTSPSDIVVTITASPSSYSATHGSRTHASLSLVLLHEQTGEYVDATEASHEGLEQGGLDLLCRVQAWPRAPARRQGKASTVAPACQWTEASTSELDRK